MFELYIILEGNKFYNHLGITKTIENKGAKTHEVKILEKY